MFAVAPLLGTLGITSSAAQRAAREARDALLRRATAAPYEPRFFTAHEWDTVRVLADLVIPKDDQSGSATDAGVPEFMDFILVEYPDNQLWMRGGLAWLDAECRHRFASDFLSCAAAQRAAVLDDIAWPAKAAPAMSQGVAFFNQFRDFTASGFFSSQMGVADLQYKGNTFLMEWQGCPPDQLARLGVTYGD